MNSFKTSILLGIIVVGTASVSPNDVFANQQQQMQQQQMLRESRIQRDKYKADGISCFDREYQNIFDSEKQINSYKISEIGAGLREIRKTCLAQCDSAPLGPHLWYLNASTRDCCREGVNESIERFADSLMPFFTGIFRQNNR